MYEINYQVSCTAQKQINIPPFFPMSQQDKNNDNMTVKQLVETNLNAKTQSSNDHAVK